MKTPALSVRVLAAVAALAITNLQAQNIVYNATLTGPGESPTNSSPGTGFATIIINPTTHVLFVTLFFAGLIGTTTASHIHAATPAPFAGTAGVATTTPTFAGFPLGVQSGTFTTTLDMTQSSTWNPAYVSANGGTLAATEAAFIASAANGTSYLNIHTSSFPGGEIRGFLVAAPETGATWSLLLFGLAGLALASRRLRRA